MKKNIQVSGFTKSQREKDLEKIKNKYEKKGYQFIEYIDDGALKSFALFEVDETIIKQEKKNRLIFWGIAIVVIIILIIPKEENFDNYKDTTLKEAQSLNLTKLKNIASSYVETKNLPESYNKKFYDCLGNLIYEKNESFTLEKMLGWCYEDYTNSNNNQMDEYYNTAELLADFSPYDGKYYPLENMIKNILMKNPSSYEHVKTTYRFVYYGAERPHMFLSTQFRGTNDFGGVVSQRVVAKVDAITKELYDIKIE